jgi:hypothetical protein
MKIKQLLQLREDDKDMENVAFGNMRKHDEKDTEWEENVFQALFDFISSATPANKAVADKILKDVQAIKSKYPNELMPNATNAMRGTQLPKERYENILASVDWDAVNRMDPFDAYHVGDISYTPRSPIQSWTTAEEIAYSFASSGDADLDGEWMHAHPFPAVMYATVDDTFIMSTSITNHIAYLNGMSSEHEIIRTSAQPIKCKLHVTVDWLIESKKYLSSS